MASRRYRLVVEGELSDRLEAAFAGMTLTRDAGNTRLDGLVRDQAELQGILRRVSDLGLTLLAVTAIGEATGTGRTPARDELADRIGDRARARRSTSCASSCSGSGPAHS